MKSFTSYLQKCVRFEWKDYYLDYVSLKSLLEKFADRRSRINKEIDVLSIERFCGDTALSKSKSFDLNKRTSFDFNVLTNSTSEEKDSKLLFEQSSLLYFTLI